MGTHSNVKWFKTKLNFTLFLEPDHQRGSFRGWDCRKGSLSEICSTRCLEGTITVERGQTKLSQAWCCTLCSSRHLVIRSNTPRTEEEISNLCRCQMRSASPETENSWFYSENKFFSLSLMLVYLLTHTLWLAGWVATYGYMEQIWHQNAPVVFFHILKSWCKQDLKKFVHNFKKILLCIKIH